MNKAELIDALAAKTGLTKTAAGQAIDALTDTIQETLVAGGSLTLVGFGTFSTGERAAREGRNPRTGETIKIAAAKTVKFSAGATLKKAVNEAKKKPAKKK